MRVDLSDLPYCVAVTTQEPATRELTPVEQELVEHVIRGEQLDLAEGEAIDHDDAAMDAWVGPRTIRAQVLRDILRVRLAQDSDPHGVRLRGAHIAGRIDLENITSRVPLKLNGCFLSEGIVASDANLSTVDLTGCRIEHPSAPPVDARRLTAPAVLLNGTRIAASCEIGAVNLIGAHLGLMDCDGAAIRNSPGPAIRADHLKVDQRLSLRNGFEASGSSEDGTIRLPAANIGRLIFASATISNYSGPAIYAERISVTQDMFFRNSTAIGAGVIGTIQLRMARLGALECDGASIQNTSGPALSAALLHVDSGVNLVNKFKAIGEGEAGAVRLMGAQIGGQLNLNGAFLHNKSGPALHAEGLKADRTVYFRDGFMAIGAGKWGAVLMMDARVGSLECDGAISNESGPALFAERLVVEQNLFLRDRFFAKGAGLEGAVRLWRARVGGTLDLDRATIENKSGPALNAYGLQVDQTLILGRGFRATGVDRRPTVDLSVVRVGGPLRFSTTLIHNETEPKARLSLDGLTYSGVPEGVSTRDWLRMLQSYTPAYAAQPYQQLAAAHRAAGHDHEVRKILMTQRRDQIRRRALAHRPERGWARLTGFVLGYGYQPWRALVALLAILAASVVLAISVGGHGGLARTHPPTPAAVNCSVVERAGVGLDMGLPLIKTNARNYCDITHGGSGQALTVLGWGLQVLAWAFATLFIAGFTGVVRKT